MIEQETGYNTYEAPRPGECYCHLLQGTQMCQLCVTELCNSVCLCEPDKICEACGGTPDWLVKKRVQQAYEIGVQLSRRRA